MEAPRGSSGRIITFYSYKGGTGRSMGLANVAWILSSAGKRVLAVDWDLEAPGLHRYFYPFLPDPDLTASDGVIDLMIEFRNEAFTKREADPPADWYKRYANILRYAASLKYKFPGTGTLDYVAAGKQGAGYSINVNTFDWQGFYDKLGGGVFLEAVRESMRSEYDYVLIDSRTGVSDTSGICTVQMPDALVVCFTLNNQSIDGASRCAAAVARRRGESSGFPIYPVAMRVEEAEREKLDLRREFMRQRFGPFLGHLDSAKRAAYWSQSEILYKPWYAYEEVLAVFGDEPGSPTSLLSAFERLCDYITVGAVTKAGFVDADVRREALAAFRRRAIDVQSTDLQVRAEALWNRLRPDQQAASRRLLERLVRLPSPGTTGPLAVGTFPTAELDPAARDVAVQWAEIGILLHEGQRIDVQVRLQSIELLTQWDRAKKWIQDDRDFLAWRQKLRADLEEWHAGGMDDGALLSGGPLNTARDWSLKRRGDLSARELDYVAASSRKRQTSRITSTLAAAVTIAVIGYGIYKGLTDQKIDDKTLAAAAMVLRADSLARAGANDEAIAAYDSSLALVPEQPAVLVARGVLRDVGGDTTDAIADFDKAIYYDSSLATAYVARASLRTRTNDHEAAIVDLDRALELDSTNSQTSFLRGRSRAALKLGKEAVEDFNRVIRSDSTNVEALLARGALYVDLGRNRDAIADYTRVTQVALDPNDRSVAVARLRALGVASGTVARREVPVVVVLADDSGALVSTVFKRAGGRWQFSLVSVRGGPVRSEVRYSAAADAGAAQELGDFVTKEFAAEGVRLRLSVVPTASRGDPGQYSNAQGVAGGPGILQLWLPPLRAAASAK